MTNVRKFTIGAASLGFLLALGLGPAPDAGAQTEPTVLGTSFTAQAAPAPPVTSPCPGCGPSGSKVPGADRAYAWPDHFCLPDGTSAYSVTFGLGRNAAGPATFYARFTTGPLPDKVLGTLQPGEQRTVYPLAVVAPGETILLDVIARNTAGVAIRFGDGNVMRAFELTCPCERPPATTSPPSSGPPTTPASSVPGTVPPPSVTVPGTPSTLATTFELPATGDGSAWLVLSAALLGFLGFCAWLLGRKQGEA